jgi:hypothetical protein
MAPHVRFNFNSNLKEKIAFLDRAGIGPTEIGKVLGRTTTHVSRELAGLRKKKR